MKCVRDVIRVLSFDDRMSSSICDELYRMKLNSTHRSQDAVTVFQTTDDESIDKCLCDLPERAIWTV